MNAEEFAVKVQSSEGDGALNARRNKCLVVSHTASQIKFVPWQRDHGMGTFYALV